MRVIELRQQIGRGEYRVNPHAVAEAIVRRMQERAATSASVRASARSRTAVPQRQ
ncbi:MAG: flagellar biosynthesis anti-sigma factor FlgM [Solirubrobacterales bacterium]|nr:flagellar biosynthesis anti-sigma factor FlgM [Solirubrobacterales bacterium]